MIRFMFALLISLFALCADAGTLEKSSTGSLRISDDATWQSTGITVSPEAAKYPNTVIATYTTRLSMLADETTITKQRGFWHSETTTTTTHIVYDTGKKDVATVESVRTTTSVSALSVCWLFAVGAMI